MPRSIPVAVLALVATLVAAACAGIDPAIVDGGAQSVDMAAGSTSTTFLQAQEAPATSTTTSTTVPDAPDVGVAVVPAGGAPLAETPGGPITMTVAEGVLLPFLDRQGDWLEVFTTCNPTAWVSADTVEIIPQATPSPPGPGFDVAQAVVVLDPGHGDRDWGGVGPSGTAEKHMNLDIAVRVRALMAAAQTPAWSTETAAPTRVPAFGRVLLTRDPDGPNDGDYELGLAYRAELANAAGADVFVSIHNNTVPKIDTEVPGTEVFYAVSVEESDRLASLIYEELMVAFAPFEADWRGGALLGARARVDPDSGTDYYGILRRAAMPSVIVEGVYISEPEEEALLRTEAFRQAYAGGVYRGIVRFLTTDERAGDVINGPEPFPDDAGTVNTSKCVVPSQP